MRTACDETADALSADALEHGPDRSCVLTGHHASRRAMIRLIAGPDGTIWPDLGARFSGRGAWITPDRALLAEAIANGRLKRAVARVLRTGVTIADDLAERIADGLERRCLDRLGLEHRAGHLILGSDRIASAARAGRLRLLLHAADAAADGCARLDQALRAGGGAMTQVILVPVGREALSRALGRENMVHIGVADDKAAARTATDLRRWLAFAGQHDSDGTCSGSEVLDGEDDSAGGRWPAGTNGEGVGGPLAGQHSDEGRE